MDLNAVFTCSEGEKHHEVIYNIPIVQLCINRQYLILILYDKMIRRCLFCIEETMSHSEENCCC